MPKHAANGTDGIPADPERGRRADPASDDERIGLTEAFSPVGDGDAAFDEAARAGDEHIGLTEAFAPVGEGAHAGGFSYKGDNEDAYPDALQSLEPPDRPPLLVGDDSMDRDAARERVGGMHGQEEPSEYLGKSRRTRRVLVGVIIVLLALFAAAIVAGVMLVRTASETAVQMAASTPASSADAIQEGVEDASSGTEKLVAVPNLGSLLGLGQDEAIEQIGLGATVTSTREVSEEGNPVRTNLTIALTEEPADSRSGTPSVYLGLDEGGSVVQAGYSAPTASLGYGSLSFADAVSNDHVIEKTLGEAGVSVEEGAAVLPEDKSEYSTYDSDGTTLMRESCTFEGEGQAAGKTLPWSATLTYDYTTANASDNLVDTIRLIYVYVNA